MPPHQAFERARLFDEEMIVKQVNPARAHQAGGDFASGAVQRIIAEFRNALIHIKIVEKQARVFRFGIDFGARPGKH